MAGRKWRRQRRERDHDVHFHDRDNLDHDCLRTLIAALEEFPVATVVRGSAYFKQGRVGEIDTWTDGAFAVVRGQRPYRVVWTLDDELWLASCECPVGVRCKHAFALGLSLVSPELSRFPSEWTARLAALSGESGPQRVAGAPASTAEHSGRSRDERAIESLRSAELLSLRRAALSELIVGGPLHDHVVYEVADELNESDPDMRCLRLAVAIDARTGDWVPPALRPYLEREDLRRRWAERQQEEARRRMVLWLNTESPVDKRQFRAEIGLECGHGDRVVASLTVLVTSAQLLSAPRTFEQVRQAWSNVRTGGRATSLPQRLLLDWLVDGLSHEGYYSPGGMRPNGWMLRSLNRFQSSRLVTWASDIDPALAARAGIAAGAPVIFSADPLRLELDCLAMTGRNMRLGLSYRWPDGSTRPLNACLLLDSAGRSHGGPDEAFVISGGVVHDAVCDLPGDVLGAFEAVREIELAADANVDVLARMASRVPSVGAELERHTHHYPVMPIVTLDLRDDDRFEIRVFASSIDASWIPLQPVGEAVVFEFANRLGWKRLAGEQRGGLYQSIQVNGSPDEPLRAGDTEPQIDAAQVWREAPRHEDVVPILEWLRGLGALPLEQLEATQEIGWTLPARGKAMARFAEAWERAPAGTRFYGNAAARRLLDRGRRLVPRLRVSASGLDWLEVSATWQAEGVTLTDEDMTVLRNATTSFVRLPSGWVRREAAGEHDEVSSVLADLGVEAGDAPTRLSVFALAGASAETLEALGGLDADEETMAAVRRLRERIDEFEGVPRVRVPRRFRGELRPYQRDGLDFLAHAAGLGIGALLADDMGLGKTIQTLAWLQWLRDNDPDGGPALVVCPASVTHNWVAEAAQFTPKMKLLALGRGTERFTQMAELENVDMVVTNYALLRRDAALWKVKRLRALILDEAQNVKNPDAAVTRTVRAIDARYRLALTGTPIENRALDLWSIADCVNPGYLGARADFASRFDGLEVPPHRRTLLAAKLRPILLRRTKSEVAPDLPDRIEETRRCELTKGQRQLYLAELGRSRKLIAELDEEPDALRRNKISILAALTRLRQICCHPALAGGKESLGSGKFDGLFEVIEPLIDEGHKVLVFSQFVECLNLLQEQFRQRRIPTHVLTGRTVKREEVVRRFNDDRGPCVFLISLKAGGTGLNLTSASYVVLFDPWWNPAVEAQAIDRTHRIGQDRTVIAYRLIAGGTIEEKIRELQCRKEGLVRDVLGEGGFARSLTRVDLDYLLEPS